MKKLLWIAGSIVVLAVLLFAWGIIYTRPLHYTPPASWGKQTSDSVNNYHPGATHDEARRLGVE